MEEKTPCSGCRFITGDRSIIKTAKTNSKQLLKTYAVAANAVVFATVTVVLSIAVASRMALETVRVQFPPNGIALLSLALVFDFVMIAAISLGAGTVIFLFARDTFALSDIPKAILSVLPCTSVGALTAVLCRITAEYFPGNERYLITAAIIFTVVCESKRYLFFPAAVAILDCDAKSARIISERACSSDRSTAKHLALGLLFSCAVSYITLLIGAVFAFPCFFAKYVSTAKLILPDYSFLISYNQHSKGEKAWQAKKNSL